MNTSKKKSTIDFVSEPDLANAASHTEFEHEIEQKADSEELEALRVELEEAKDRTLRARAELENYRARINRQMETDKKYASIDLMRDLLPVWDNLGRALQAAGLKSGNLDSGDDGGNNGLAEGVRLVYEQFEDVLKKHHCIRLNPLYEPFDPNFEESVAMIPCADYPPNTVIEETLCGFKLHDRVVRPSQVVLAASVQDF